LSAPDVLWYSMGMDNPEPLLIPYYMSCLAGGYRYECTCGEVHREERSAWECRECRLRLTQLVFDSRQVVDIVIEYGER
jgi:hypothetical protein